MELSKIMLKCRQEVRRSEAKARPARVRGNEWLAREWLAAAEEWEDAAVTVEALLAANAAEHEAEIARLEAMA